MKPRRTTILTVLIILVIVIPVWFINKKSSEKLKSISSFEQCKAAGHPIMESYPERCSAGGKTFTNLDQKVINP